MGRASGFKPGATEEEDNLPWYVFGAARRAALAAKRGRGRDSVMSSDKNVTTGTGRGTTTFGPPPALPKRARPSTVKDSMDIPVSPVVETAGITGLPGGPSGVSTEREAASGSTTFFGPTPEDAAQVAEQMPRMRKGLFGEDISQEDWDRMTQKNKEGSFWGRFKKGGQVKKKTVKKSSGGKVSSASKRADGCASKGKTRGRMV